ncbi:MAG TPA: adenylate/guanylate cyclase domain-containing protein [Anaerolineales bacterium]
MTKITALAADPEDSEEDRLRKSLLLGACFVFIPVVFPWIVVYFAFGEPLAAAISSFYFVASSLLVVIFLYTRRFNLLLISQQTLILLLPFAFMLALGGFANSSAVMLWAVICPLGSLIIAEPRYAPRWLLGYLALLALGSFLQPYLRSSTNLPDALVVLFFALNIGVVSIIIFILLHYFVREKNEAYRLLSLEQGRTEALLLNVLPKEIAPILKTKGGTIADHFDSVSILFADVVGFTPLSSELTPEEMVELLNEIFSYFDSLVEKYDLEKIRTIGDNYMVAAGLPRPRPDHPQVMAQMALEMLDYLDKRPAQKGRRISFRVGINTGPVVAGVIGRSKFHYDVWGDTVNTASRMESHGVAGKIQITRATYELIKDEFACEARGIVSVKGKGEMETWFLVGRSRQ